MKYYGITTLQVLAKLKYIVIFSIIISFTPAQASELLEGEQLKKKFQEDAQFNLLQNGKGMHFIGVITKGSARAFKRFIKKHKQLEYVVFSSPGGYQTMGLEIGRAIARRDLDTYALYGCIGSCVLAFFYGKNRFLVANAWIGFASTRLESLYSYENEREQYKLRRKSAAIKLSFIKRGLSKEFADKAFDFRGREIWYPTKNELLEGRLIHSSVSTSVFSEN